MNLFLFWMIVSILIIKRFYRLSFLLLSSMRHPQISDHWNSLCLFLRSIFPPSNWSGIRHNIKAFLGVLTLRHIQRFCAGISTRACLPWIDPPPPPTTSTSPPTPISPLFSSSSTPSGHNIKAFLGVLTLRHIHRFCAGISARACLPWIDPPPPPTPTTRACLPWIDPPPPPTPTTRACLPWIDPPPPPTPTTRACLPWIDPPPPPTPTTRACLPWIDPTPPPTPTPTPPPTTTAAPAPTPTPIPVAAAASLLMLCCQILH
ncbi:formin-like protein 5 [Olea europaea var. sylvestris]|uniref:formin-like protein 5 n=1 Tax=Olea europaea var. sylvestris TaxID=158386 RepID=UPI000C1D4BB1|nr:formin-like protein 5 [Olea europaea var. sylvestris]